MVVVSAIANAQHKPTNSVQPLWKGVPSSGGPACERGVMGPDYRSCPPAGNYRAANGRLVAVNCGWWVKHWALPERSLSHTRQTLHKDRRRRTDPNRMDVPTNVVPPVKARAPEFRNVNSHKLRAHGKRRTDY